MQCFATSPGSRFLQHPGREIDADEIVVAMLPQRFGETPGARSRVEDRPGVAGDVPAAQLDEPLHQRTAEVFVVGIVGIRPIVVGPLESPAFRALIALAARRLKSR